MSFVANLRQAVTYWAPTGTGGFGETTYAAPVTVLGRWEDKLETIINAAGEEVVSMSRVFLNIDPLIDGYLFLGTSVGADPRNVTGAMVIQNVSKTPDLRNLTSLKVAFL